MIERAYIFVDGPPKSGKTTFVEHVLRAYRNELLLAARFVPAKKPKDAGPAKGNAETTRYQKAGAIGTMLFRVPAEPDLFWTSDLVENYSRGIVVEGEVVEDILSPDLVVYVIRPLPESLLVKGPRGPRQVDRESMDLMERVIFHSDPLRLAALHEFERMLPKLGLTPRGTGWTIRKDCAGITRANVVVINVHDESERPAAEELAAEVRRIREDPEIKGDVLGMRANRRQPAILVANLADPKDKELKKALARVKGVMKNRSS